MRGGPGEGKAVVTDVELAHTLEIRIVCLDNHVNELQDRQLILLACKGEVCCASVAGSCVSPCVRVGTRVCICVELGVLW